MLPGRLSMCCWARAMICSDWMMNEYIIERPPCQRTFRGSGPRVSKGVVDHTGESRPSLTVGPLPRAHGHSSVKRNLS